MVEVEGYRGCVRLPEATQGLIRKKRLRPPHKQLFTSAAVMNLKQKLAFWSNLAWEVHEVRKVQE